MVFVDRVISVEKKKFQLVDRFSQGYIYHGYCDTLASVSPRQFDEKKTRKKWFPITSDTKWYKHMSLFSTLTGAIGE